MNSSDFCYWLQGYFELTKTDQLTPDQVQVIKEHLSLVFNKVTEKQVLKDLTFCTNQLQTEHNDGTAINNNHPYIQFMPGASC